jgi:hypothetical protein
MRKMRTKVLATILVLGFFALSSSTKGQTQKGADIDGEAAGDHSGYSVSMPDANTIAIGARQNDGNMGLGADVGHVRIYKWNGTSWLQKGADIDGEATTDDQSGYSVSMPDTNTVAIGTPFNDGNGADAGHVRVFEWNGTSWIQKGADMDGDSIGDHLGQSVSMPDANTVVMGATQPGATFDGGYVRIYQWNGTSWAQKGTDILSEAPDDRFGVSVSMPDTNTVAIGASNNDGNGLNAAGHVRIYEWNGSDWAQKGTDIDGETQFNYSGSSVSMPDANTVAIGAPNNNGQGIINCGHVRVYQWNGVAWVQKGGDIDGEATQDLSGSSVSMPDSNTVAIGAYKNDGNGADAGHVRVYKWNGTAWEQKELDIDGEAADDLSGYSVSMPDSNTVAIGAHKNDGNGADAGNVRVYSYSLCTDTSSSTISPTACYSYVSPSGNYIWSTSGTYMDTIPNSAGCDSVITINLTINTVDTGITNNSPTLVANATGASYQWLDCGNNYANIPGATNQSFTATANGNYAVQVTENGCTDTSACVNIINVGVVEHSFDNDFLVFPNPTYGQLNIQFGSAYSNVHVIVRNPLGQQILNKNYTSTGSLNLTIDGDAGIYFVEIKGNDRQAVLKVIKE